MSLRIDYSGLNLKRACMYFQTRTHSDKGWFDLIDFDSYILMVFLKCYSVYIFVVLR